MTTLDKRQRVANPTYEPQPYSVTGYPTFRSFYPYYLGEHAHPVCLVGTTISLSVFVRALLAVLPLLSPAKQFAALRFGTQGWKSVGKLLLGGLLQGYVWAWIGHFFFERNKPATFKHPFYSLLGDLTLWKEVATLKRRP
ncbi:uncharacterized protein JCM10292_001491 [Rhodotorula paludigena]|uniref:uncharacterized protein n=1 Tax=Rhodotorula paludigena TaxID=86838 RepID=UPI003170EF81